MRERMRRVLTAAAWRTSASTWPSRRQRRCRHRWCAAQPRVQRSGPHQLTEDLDRRTYRSYIAAVLQKGLIYPTLLTGGTLQYRQDFGV